MENKIIDGKKASSEILADIQGQIDALSGRKPCLAVVLVGNDEASKVYVKNKKLACERVGIKSVERLLDDSATEEELLEIVNKLNLDPTIDGILVQLPLPKHLNSKIIMDSIFPNKDVDGFHRYNMGSLALNSPNISPCTPHGVMYLLDSLKIDYHGKNAVVLGSSNIVGRPMALELLNRGATVTICNSKTLDLPNIANKADILVAAVGRPHFVTKQFIKNGAIVIDVGINRDINGKLCGDVDFDQIVAKVSKITPVPGGVGPMTIAMLIANTMKCYLANNSHLKSII